MLFEQILDMKYLPINIPEQPFKLTRSQKF